MFVQYIYCLDFYLFLKEYGSFKRQEHFISISQVHLSFSYLVAVSILVAVSNFILFLYQMLLKCVIVTNLFFQSDS